ncbi:M23 family metallopeptidase [Alkalicoccobacillus porphyridii]|uniref:M23 family metallopeptidase n=1 Tax=Alkalicoccobacillus porphyridii TaxID=2597270 RepID=A0A553ZXM8_9BACI|nr:M23 family metallopeptidase [Alkalicoccobacillus porphyridii]TSB46207.1 M23 family metallopeptidase [Alkalicoccobacillus porphyridii]
MSKQDLRKVRRRIEARRKTIQASNEKQPFQTTKSVPSNYTKVKESDYDVIPEPNQKSKNRVGSFTLRMLFCTVIFLALLIMFQTDQARLEPVKQTVAQSFEQEIQFAAISHWYETNFGRPLTLLPRQADKENANNQPDPPIELTPYAVPASGTIRENFDQNGKGVLIETGEGIEVHAATGGFVTDVTEKEDIGTTVILQHYDGTESTYGMLDEITVTIYDHIEAGQELGTVSKSEDDKGIYYFALKKGKEYINPNEVITFE